MALCQWLDAPRKIFAIVIFLLTITVSLCETECFYELETIGDITFLGSFPCKYGCCGTTSTQRCCTKQERYKNYAQGTTWRIVAIVILSILVLITIALVLTCILKKKNKKKMRIYDVQGDSRRRGFSSVSQSIESDPPPPYALSIVPSTGQSQPPAYSFIASGSR